MNHHAIGCREHKPTPKSQQKQNKNFKLNGNPGFENAWPDEIIHNLQGSKRHSCFNREKNECTTALNTDSLG